MSALANTGAPERRPARPWRARWVRLALALPLLLWLAVCGVLYTIQDALVFVPSPTIEHTPAELGLDFEEVRLATRDGETIHGWFVAGERARGTVVYCHGNGGNIGGLLSFIAATRERNLDLFVFDYRGYGRSSGAPSEAGAYEDLAAVWTYLTRERGIPPASIVVWGRSLGGAMAVYLATEIAALTGPGAPAAVVLEATFTSLPDTAAERYWMFPVQVLVHTKLPSLARIPRLQVPLLLAHSPDDTLVPFAHGQRLFAAAASRNKQLLELHGDHNEGHLAQPQYAAVVAEFLDQVLPPSPVSREPPPSP